MDLTGKRALVTGAGKRLGREFALALARSGADVVVHYATSEKEATATADEIRSLGRKAEIVAADLSRPDGAAFMERVGDLDVLVNSAAIFEKGTVADTSLEDWERHLSLNLRAPFLLSQAFTKALGDRPGKIVNVADWRAVSPGRAYLAYVISKAGLLTLTQFAAREFAPRVQVNALALGAVLPPSDGSAMEEAVKRTPAGRAATVTEACDGLLFLIKNDFVTGETLFVDGGAHL